MIRAFHAAASGMRAQQKSIDLISNNIANVNTTGFKSKRAAFKDLVYSDMEIRRVAAPPNLQVGNGVRVGAAMRSLVQGTPVQTGRTLDVSIIGDGYFAVATEDGSLRYTRDGSFNISVMNDGEGFVNRLTTSDGLFVLNSDGRPIEFASGIDVSALKIDQDGTIAASNANGEAVPSGRLAVVSFANPGGLSAAGDNLFEETPASGEGVAVAEPSVMQGFLEASNVDMADEMTRLIMAQRAYQLSARVLQTADDMESMANNLRR
jgi:flagellar basal-body rod protein FlgG